MSMAMEDEVQKVLAQTAKMATWNCGDVKQGFESFNSDGKSIREVPFVVDVVGTK